MAVHKDRSSATHFLNVDLDIYSRHDLQPLVRAFGRKVIALYVGPDRRRYCAHLELARFSKSADSTIRAFCGLLKSLPSAEQDLWNAAEGRDFNIGVQAGTHPHSSEFALAAETLKAAHELGARIVLTVYAPEEPRKSVAKGRAGSKKVDGAAPGG